MKKIVSVGGGTGTYQVLTGLKKLPLEISAIISMCDSGGSTGKLRRELGILPPGDVRRAILALSDLPFAQKTLEEVFDFRFGDEGRGSLAGHSLGNILLAALVQITGSMDKAINEAARILNASGKVYPVTLDKSNLVAVLDDGTKVHGETNIDMRNFKLKHGIKNVYLTPKARVFKDAAKAILEADLIVLGPGDLYTSIVPTLLVEGVVDAIKNSKAKLVYVVNLMTKRGETDNFRASDFVSVLKKYLGQASDKLNFVLVNRQLNNKQSDIDKWYKRYGSKPVINDLTKKEEFKVIEKNFVATTTLFRHDPEKIAKVLSSLV
ncbi:YvcK family protein [Candidatus Microgenomates bacterium]|nr:YvcK family protein [Candidatus Microgenomates bacterium]